MAHPLLTLLKGVWLKAMLTVRPHVGETRAKPVFYRKCVSTIRDECSGVGLEISTKSKQRGRRKTEDIVSANGDIG